MTDTTDQVRRWSTAQAATVSHTAASGAPEPAPQPVSGVWGEPVPAVLTAFTEVAAWDGATEQVNRVAWAHGSSGPLLATGTIEGIARIWDARSGTALQVLAGHSDVIGGTQWGRTHDGRLLLATSAYDGTARIWDPDTGECLHTLVSRRLGADESNGSIDWNVSVTWGLLPGDVPVVITGDGMETVRFWEPESGRQLDAFTLSGREPGGASGSDDIYALDWAQTADGHPRLAVGSFRGRILRVLDPETRQVLRSSTYDRPVTWFSYGHRADGQLVLASAGEGESIWAEENGAFISQALSPIAGGISGACWAPLADGRLLLATVSGQGMQIWDGHTLSLLHAEALDGNRLGPVCLDWTLTPDGHLLLADASREGRVHVWEAVLDPPVRPVATGPSASTALHVRQPARLVLPPEEVTPRFAAVDGLGEATINLACAPAQDGRTLVAVIANVGSDVQVWDLESGGHVRTLAAPGHGPGDVAWARTSDGRLYLATAGTDGTAQIWDMETGAVQRTLAGHIGTVYGVAWGTRPHGALLLATAGRDSTVRIWDPETGRELHTLSGHQNIVYGVAWGTRANGTLLLATASFDGTARIWDPETGQALHTLIGHDGIVECVAWTTSADGALLLATCGHDGTARVWDPETGRELRRLGDSADDGALYGVAWGRTSDGRLLLATAADSGATRIWDPDTGAKLAALPPTGSNFRSIAWATDTDENLLLLLGSGGNATPPFRSWLVENGTGRRSQPQQPRQAVARRQAAQAGRQLLRLGASGLWLPLGLLADLVSLTGNPGAELNDARLAVLADEPGLGRLRQLGAGQPPWNHDARAAFAAMLAAGLDVPARYIPPADTATATLATMLSASLAAPQGVPAATWQAPVAELRAAATAVNDRMVTLLAILGPDACAADPLLPLRLAHHAPRLPALSPRELRFLSSAAGRPPAGAPAAAVGTLTYSPGTAGLARTGPPTRLLPTQLALPHDLLTTRLAANQLLYRQHRAPVPPAPEPVTLILDTTPPVYGPAGQALRVTAHLIATILWEHGHHPYLVTPDKPGTAISLDAPADLLAIWTRGTLSALDPVLGTALSTAAATGQPALLLTHHQTARDCGYHAGRATRLLTSHQPPEKPPAEPASPWHAHIPPNPAQEQLTSAIARLLAHGTEGGRAAP